MALGMILSPVIGRELRQQARRPSTIWMRTIAAMLGGLCAIATLRLTAAAGIGGVLPGKIMFNTLSVVLFVIRLFEGVRQTSDCLSSEKREGTLGLLLLTDLRGFDLVLGKLTAISVGSVYALMAVFPAMAMALPYGGLTGGEFWRVQLVLLVTLFFGEKGSEMTNGVIVLFSGDRSSEAPADMTIDIFCRVWV